MTFDEIVTIMLLLVELWGSFAFFHVRGYENAIEYRERMRCMEDKMMNRARLIQNMTENLPMLRKRLGLTQEELAEKIGVSRSTVISIENKKREMTWNTFLSLMLVFTKNESTDKLLNVLEIYTDEFHDFIRE